MTEQPPPNLLPLKILVISMGLVLIGGFVYVVAAVSEGLQKTSAANCADVTVTLPLPATPKDARATADGFTVTQQDGSRTVLYRYNTCGKLLQKVTFKGKTG
jgi:cytochrome oxidase Cu insertion factor (SCO1/SenC/PrrC family)